MNLRIRDSLYSYKPEPAFSDSICLIAAPAMTSKVKLYPPRQIQWLL
jgi:hypothetical protein